MPTYTSTVPEIFTNPPEKSISQGKKSGQLTDELVKQYFDQVTPAVSFVVPLSTVCFSVTLSLLILPQRPWKSISPGHLPRGLQI